METNRAAICCEPIYSDASSSIAECGDLPGYHRREDAFGSLQVIVSLIHSPGSEPERWPSNRIGVPCQHQ